VLEDGVSGLAGPCTITVRARRCSPITSPSSSAVTGTVAPSRISPASSFSASSSCSAFWITRFSGRAP
jgi:hypothetical protein